MAQLLRQAIDSCAPPSLARIPVTPEEVAASYDEVEDGHDGEDCGEESAGALKNEARISDAVPRDRYTDLAPGFPRGNGTAGRRLNYLTRPVRSPPRQLKVRMINGHSISDQKSRMGTN